MRLYARHVHYGNVPALLLHLHRTVRSTRDTFSLCKFNSHHWAPLLVIGNGHGSTVECIFFFFQRIGFWFLGGLALHCARVQIRLPLRGLIGTEVCFYYNSHSEFFVLGKWDVFRAQLSDAAVTAQLKILFKNVFVCVERLYALHDIEKDRQKFVFQIEYFLAAFFFF